jgi:pimeloyl-ACP methyl ester carboxylesterase
MTDDKKPTKSAFCRSGNHILYAEQWGSAEQTGDPTVIYEPGSLIPPGTNNPGWWPIRDAILANLHLPVFLYDRAGLGQSEPVPLPRPLSAFTTDLHNVLHEFGNQPPYLLVGGSFGGMLVLHYASLYPDEVMGVLLVDSTHPEHNQRTLTVLPSEAPGEPVSLREFRTLLTQLDRVPPESNDWEGLDVATSIAEARELWNLHDIPLIVLTAGVDEWEADFPIDVAGQYAQVWLDLQKEMAALSTNSKHRIVQDSDHLMHHRRPDILIESIRELVNGFQIHRSG